MTAAKIKDLTDRDQRVLVANFSHGSVNKKRRRDVSLGIFHLHDQAHIPKQLVAETENSTYTGKIQQPGSTKSKEACKYYAGVLDKRTGKMKVFNTQLVHMEPYHGTDDVDATPQLELSFKEKRDMLTSAFGSSRKRKAMESRARQDVGNDELENILGSAVDSALSKGTTKPVEPQAEDSVIPHCNREAKSIEEVYDLNDVVSTEALDSLQMNADTFFKCKLEDITEWRTKQSYGEYILKHLSSLPVEGTERLHKCKCLLYIHYLSTVYKMKASQLKKKDPLPKTWPDVVKEEILSKFTNSLVIDGRRVRYVPQRMRDKLLSHLLTLVLIYDEFKINLDDLQSETGVTITRMKNHLVGLGCYVKMNKTTTDTGQIETSYVAHLKFPLPTGQTISKRRPNKK